jgi:tRNA(fMet)-specific endonuclease VapC
MSLFVLDSDIFTLARTFHPTLTARITSEAANHDIAVTVITVEEALGGWYALLRKARTIDQTAFAYEELAATARQLTDYDILSFPRDAILRFDALLKLKLGVKKNDLRIAAIALEAGAVVVTRNLRDFRRVPGLTCEDWSV